MHYEFKEFPPCIQFKIRDLWDNTPYPIKILMLGTDNVYGMWKMHGMTKCLFDFSCTGLQQRKIKW